MKTPRERKSTYWSWSQSPLDDDCGTSLLIAPTLAREGRSGTTRLIWAQDEAGAERLRKHAATCCIQPTLISPNWISQQRRFVRSVNSTVPCMSPRGIAEYRMPARRAWHVLWSLSRPGISLPAFSPTKHTQHLIERCARGCCQLLVCMALCCTYGYGVVLPLVLAAMGHEAALKHMDAKTAAAETDTHIIAMPHRACSRLDMRCRWSCCRCGTRCCGSPSRSSSPHWPCTARPAVSGP